MYATFASRVAINASSLCWSSTAVSRSRRWRSMAGLLREHVDQQIFRIGPRAGFGEIDGGLEVALDLPADLRDVRRRRQPLRDQVVLQARDRIALATSPVGEDVRRPRLRRRRVAHRVEE